MKIYIYKVISHDQHMSEFNSKHIIYTSVYLPMYGCMDWRELGREGGREG